MALTLISQATVGTAATQLITAGTWSLGPGVVLCALPGNSGNCYFGGSTSVTTTNGFPLPKGVPITISKGESSDGSAVYLIADAASQKVSYWPITYPNSQG